MKKSKNGNYVLSEEELFSLVSAFGSFREILVLDSDGSYYTDGNLACLCSSDFASCSRLFDSYFGHGK